MTRQRWNPHRTARAMLAFGLLVWCTDSILARPAPATTQTVLTEAEELACAPRLAAGGPLSPFTLVGSQEGSLKNLLGPATRSSLGQALTRAWRLVSNISCGVRSYRVTATGPTPRPLLGSRPPGGFES